MTSTYYRYLFIAFIVFSLIPLSYWLFLELDKSNISSQSVKQTSYNFEFINAPIQPIPTSIEIDKEWMILGKALFNSPLLSADNTIACASCHMVDFGGDDGFSVSTGVNNKQGVRNSPTVLNAVFNIRQFWDGRSADLTEQASGPIHNPVEMATSWPDVIGKLKNDNFFKTTFAKLSNQGITENNIVKAIVTYEESLITPGAAIDRYVLGDKEALSQQQVRGYDKFINLGCATCHQGRNIGGNILQRLGQINAIPDILKDDLGKFEVSQNVADSHVFKVPSLRNIAQTAPYFHNGSVSELSDAVNIMAQVQLGITLSAQDNNDIVALLHAFSAPPMEIVSHEVN